MNSTWLITSDLANQGARKVLFTCVVYTNWRYPMINFQGCRYLVMEFMFAGDLQKVFELHKYLFSEMQARLNKSKNGTRL